MVHSAKSWLAHHSADRAAAFLPWGSEDIDEQRKISPLRASALILNALRGAWNDRFANAGVDFQFDLQDITITVPASFDAAAQRLTLDAAAEAGYPAGVRLLEEPQAAFYAWLERHDATADLAAKLPPTTGDAPHVLVVDIGGGTSDFSLFELGGETRSAPAIRRVAVSEHLLLGGDNIDLALAHLVEGRLAGDEEHLVGSQWHHLVARCRDLEGAGAGGGGDGGYTLPDRHSGAWFEPIRRLGRNPGVARRNRHSAVRRLLSPCAADERPRRTHAALKEWGLPFATDSRVTRHLAEFLAGRPRVDAVLFNGGSLYPKVLRQRLADAIASWQNGAVPLLLDNPSPDLAVARGAARFGKLIAQKAERIAAGAARAVFIAAHSTQRVSGDGEKDPSLICILPRGANPEDSFDISNLALELRVNRPVRFQAYSSTRHGDCRAGDVVAWNARDFHPLPPLETVAKAVTSGHGDALRSLPVSLRARINDLGLLQLACVSTEPSTDPAQPQSWPLEFNLRPQDVSAALLAVSAAAVTANVDARSLTAGIEAIGNAFARSYQRDKLTATRLFRSLESALGLARADWNWMLVRSLWPALEDCLPQRAASPDHEETWLIIAGFLLRPGFGAPLDDLRLDGLWRLREAGLAFPGKRSRLQEHILWRRLAGGLSPNGNSESWRRSWQRSWRGAS